MTGVGSEYSVFLTLQFENQLPYTVYGRYKAKSESHIIKVDYPRVMTDKILGKYEVTIYA